MTPEEFYANTLEIEMLASVLVKTWHQALMQYLAEHGVNVSALQFGVLRMLKKEQQTLTELSVKMVLHPSTLVPAVDSLVRQGYVQRGKDPRDRRRTPLSITEQGVELLDTLPRIGEGDAVLNAMRQIGAERALHLRDLLRDVVRHLPDGEEALCSFQERLKLLDKNTS